MIKIRTIVASSEVSRLRVTLPVPLAAIVAPVPHVAVSFLLQNHSTITLLKQVIKKLSGYSVIVVRSIARTIAPGWASEVPRIAEPLALLVPPAPVLAVVVVILQHGRDGGRRFALVLLRLSFLVVAEVVEDRRGVTVRVQNLQHLSRERNVLGRPAVKRENGPLTMRPFSGGTSCVSREFVTGLFSLFSSRMWRSAAFGTSFT